jgi:hypothetical protein
MALLQPCTNDRVPCGPPHWIGPVTNEEDAAVLRDWLERGQWEDAPLPTQLTGHQLWVRNASRSN